MGGNSIEQFSNDTLAEIEHSDNQLGAIEDLVEDYNIQLVSVDTVYEYSHADGTIHRAESTESARQACPVLGKMATEQASLLLEIAAIGQQKINTDKKQNSHFDKSNDPTDTSPINPIRTITPAKKEPIRSDRPSVDITYKAQYDLNTTINQHYEETKIIVDGYVTESYIEESDKSNDINPRKGNRTQYTSLKELVLDYELDKSDIMHGQHKPTMQSANIANKFTPELNNAIDDTTKTDTQTTYLLHDVNQPSSHEADEFIETNHMTNEPNNMENIVPAVVEEFEVTPKEIITYPHQPQINISPKNSSHQIIENSTANHVDIDEDINDQDTSIKKLDRFINYLKSLAELDYQDAANDSFGGVLSVEAKSPITTKPDKFIDTIYHKIQNLETEVHNPVISIIDDIAYKLDQIDKNEDSLDYNKSLSEIEYQIEILLDYLEIEYNEHDTKYFAMKLIKYNKLYPINNRIIDNKKLINKNDIHELWITNSYNLTNSAQDITGKLKKHIGQVAIQLFGNWNVSSINNLSLETAN